MTSQGMQAASVIGAPRPVAVEARPGHRIWLRYSDGVEGEVDLSHLVGRGAFAAWDEPGFFDGVHISPVGDSIEWNASVEICPETQYEKLTGRPAAQDRSSDGRSLNVEANGRQAGSGVPASSSGDSGCDVEWVSAAEPEMLLPLEVKPRPGFRIWLRYADGVEGEVDLSDHVGKGVFAVWEEPGLFERVRITPWRTIAWSDDAELCADALYLELTGKTVDEIWPVPAADGVGA